MTVTKTDMIDYVSNEAKLTKANSAIAIEAVLNGIKHFISKGEDVKFIGFGHFGIIERAAREGRNPRTGDKIKIEAGRHPVFKAGKELRDAVKQK